MPLLNLLFASKPSLAISYPSTTNNNTNFTWSILNGNPGDGWWATATGAFSRTYGSQASPYAYLDNSGNATYTNGNFSPNIGNITLTFYFQSGAVITKNVTVTATAPTVTVPSTQTAGTPFVWTISGGVAGMTYMVRSTGTVAGGGDWGAQLLVDPTGSITNVQALDQNGYATNTIYRSKYVTPPYETVINPFGTGWDYGAANIGRTITLTFSFSNGAVVIRTIQVLEPTIAFTSTIYSVAGATYSKDYYWVIAGSTNGKLLVSTDRGVKFYQKTFAYQVNGVLTQRTDVNIYEIKYFPFWGTNPTGLWLARTSIGLFYGYVTLWANAGGSFFNSNTYSSMEWIPFTDLNNILGGVCEDAVYWDSSGAVYAIGGVSPGKKCVRYGFFGAADIGVTREAVFSKVTTTYINSVTSTTTITNNYTPTGRFLSIYAPVNAYDPTYPAKSSVVIGDTSGKIFQLAADPSLGSIYPTWTNHLVSGVFEFREFGTVYAYDPSTRTTIPKPVYYIRATKTSTYVWNYMAYTQYNLAIPMSDITSGNLPSQWDGKYNTYTFPELWQEQLTNVSKVGLIGTGVYSVEKFSQSVPIEGRTNIKNTPLIGGDRYGKTYYLGDVPTYNATSGGFGQQYAAIRTYQIRACCSIPINISGYTDGMVDFYVGDYGTIQKKVYAYGVSTLSNTIINNGTTAICVYLQI